uniref:Uncharacterized protein n=1 Tax=Caenorhabditis tropicalis TaxID=1561998 RepID=A0A1I7U992_9PELO
MNCYCGDPSCGYCQAARVPHSNNYYPFDDFVPMDPFDRQLRTIFEDDENKEVVDVQEEAEDEEEDENEYIGDPNHEIVMTKEISQLDLESEEFSNTQINELQVRFYSFKTVLNVENSYC